MKFKLISSALLLVISLAILFVSILRTASVVPDFPQGNTRAYDTETVIDYPLVYPGEVLPGHPLWGLKALRDRLWLVATTDNTKKAELLLLLADKRLSAAQRLMEMGDNTNALLSLVKAEHYLKAANDQRLKSPEVKSNESLLERLAHSSLKHREVLVNAKYILPEEAVADIVLAENLAIEVYETSKSSMLKKSIAVPESPF